ncbi:MAG: hypothetical protein RXR01_10215 [Thermoproteus sp.]
MKGLFQAILEATVRKCEDELGDEALCRRAIELAADVAAKKRIEYDVETPMGTVKSVTAWLYDHENLSFAADVKRGEVVLEFTGSGVPTVIVTISASGVRSLVASTEYVALGNPHDPDILRVVKAIATRRA